MRMHTPSLWGLSALVLTALSGCEGSTSMSHSFHNLLPDTLHVIARFDSLPWNDSVDVHLAPGQTFTRFTYHMRGKCSQCGDLQGATAWIDTLEVPGRTWLDYPDVPADWWTEVSEGRTWIRFDHTLRIGSTRVE
jgi:hypothetical protein